MVVDCGDGCRDDGACGEEVHDDDGLCCSGHCDIVINDHGRGHCGSCCGGGDCGGERDNYDELNSGFRGLCRSRRRGLFVIVVLLLAVGHH